MMRVTHKFSLHSQRQDLSVQKLTRPPAWPRNSIKKIFGIFFLAAVLLSVIFMVRPGNISSLEVDGDVLSCLSADQIGRETGLVGSNFWLEDRKKLLEQLSARHLCLKSASLTFIFPSTAVLKAVKREAALAVISYSASISAAQESSPSAQLDLPWSQPSTPAGEMLVSDSEGFIFEKSDRVQLPVVYIPKELNIGSHLNPGQAEKVVTIFNKITQMVNDFPAAGTTLQRPVWAKIMDDSLLMDLHPRVIFSLKKDILRQLASLQLILQKAKINIGGVETIDLRFDKPVIK